MHVHSKNWIEKAFATKEKVEEEEEEEERRRGAREGSCRFA